MTIINLKYNVYSEHKNQVNFQTEDIRESCCFQIPNKYNILLAK